MFQMPSQFVDMLERAMTPKHDGGNAVISQNHNVQAFRQLCVRGLKELRFSSLVPNTVCKAGTRLGLSGKWMS